MKQQLASWLTFCGVLASAASTAHAGMLFERLSARVYDADLGFLRETIYDFDYADLVQIVQSPENPGGQFLWDYNGTGHELWTNRGVFFTSGRHGVRFRTGRNTFGSPTPADRIIEIDLIYQLDGVTARAINGFSGPQMNLARIDHNGNIVEFVNYLNGQPHIDPAARYRARATIANGDAFEAIVSFTGGPWMEAVPEPSSLTLGVLGLLALVLRRIAGRARTRGCGERDRRCEE